jgi:hypothetical protein
MKMLLQINNCKRKIYFFIDVSTDNYKNTFNLNENFILNLILCGLILYSFTFIYSKFRIDEIVRNLRLSIFLLSLIKVHLKA